MTNRCFIGWNDTPMNDVVIKGEKISVPVWGSTEDAILAPWSEIKKLGFKLSDRSFGTLSDNTPALFFMAHENNPYKRVWFVTTEKMQELLNS